MQKFVEPTKHANAEEAKMAAESTRLFNNGIERYSSSGDNREKIDGFCDAMAVACCSSGSVPELRSEISTHAQDFVDAFGGHIIQNALGRASDAISIEVMSKIGSINDPMLEAQLLLAINATIDEHGNVEMLMSSNFLKSLKTLDNEVAGALLYEIQIAGNIAALTSEELFTEDAVEFFNDLGQEAASEWFYSIAKTGNIADLTDERVFNSTISDAIKSDPKLASELSYAIGETGRVDLLTNPDFVEVLNGLDPIIASEYLSAIWCTRKPEALTVPKVISKVASGEANIWLDIARESRKHESEQLHVIISKEGGDSHDRASKLIVQSLMNSGIDVIYTGNIQDPKELARIAKLTGANAIGFGIMSDSYGRLVTDTIKEMKIGGVDGIVVFCGGMITQKSASSFEQQSVKVFAPGTHPDEIIRFLNTSTAQKPKNRIRYSRLMSSVESTWPGQLSVSVRDYTVLTDGLAMPFSTPNELQKVAIQQGIGNDLSVSAHIQDEFKPTHSVFTSSSNHVLSLYQRPHQEAHALQDADKIRQNSALGMQPAETVDFSKASVLSLSRIDKTTNMAVLLEAPTIQTRLLATGAEQSTQGDGLLIVPTTQNVVIQQSFEDDTYTSASACEESKLAHDFTPLILARVLPAYPNSHQMLSNRVDTNGNIQGYRVQSALPVTEASTRQTRAMPRTQISLQRNVSISATSPLQQLKSHVPIRQEQFGLVTMPHQLIRRSSRRHVLLRLLVRR